MQQHRFDSTVRKSVGRLCMLSAWLVVGCQTHQTTPVSTTQQAHAWSHDRTREQVKELIKQGCAARKAGDLERAQTRLKQAIQLAPSDGRARHAIGLVYMKLGDLYSAAVHLDAACRLLSDQVEPCYNLGLVLEKGGQYELAIEAYERALGRRPDHLATLENLARTRFKAGCRDQETLRLLTRCRQHELRPEWVQWLNRQHMRLSVLLGKEKQSVSLTKTAQTSQIETTSNRIERTE